jgi:hypothetical protein
MHAETGVPTLPSEDFPMFILRASYAVDWPSPEYRSLGQVLHSFKAYLRGSSSLKHLMYSSLLNVKYRENLPEETRQVVPQHTKSVRPGQFQVDIDHYSGNMWLGPKPKALMGKR